MLNFNYGDNRMPKDTENLMSPHEDLANLRREVRDLSQTVTALSASISNLTEAWSGAKGFLVIVKWTAAFSASCAVVWAAIHGKNPP